MWNYWLGGKDHYLADRQAGHECLAIFPGMVDTIRTLRYFTARAVRYLAAEEGVRQFLDVGCGLPFTDPVHQVAQDAAPGCRVVYADNDPLVFAHAQALLTGPSGTTGHLDADLRDTATLINRAAAMLDFTQPVAVLLVSVLGHLGRPGEGEREGARLAAAMLRDALPPGGFLVVADLAAHPEARQGDELLRQHRRRSVSRPVTGGDRRLPRRPGGHRPWSGARHPVAARA